MRKLFFAFSMCMLGLLVYSCSDDDQPGSVFLVVLALLLLLLFMQIF